MSEFSDYLENAIIDATLRGGPSLNVPQAYLALFITDPTDDGSGTECSWSTYTRQPADFDAPINGVTQNTNDILFNAVTGASVTLTHAALFDSATGGNMLYHTPLDAVKTMDVDDIAMWAPSQLTVTLQ